MTIYAVERERLVSTNLSQNTSYHSVIWSNHREIYYEYVEANDFFISDTGLLGFEDTRGIRFQAYNTNEWKSIRIEKSTDE